MYKDYDEKLRRSDKEHYREHLKKFVEIFRANSCNSVLDLGCGNGTFLDLLAESGMRGTGVEMDA